MKKALSLLLVLAVVLTTVGAFGTVLVSAEETPKYDSGIEKFTEAVVDTEAGKITGSAFDISYVKGGGNDAKIGSHKNVDGIVHYQTGGSTLTIKFPSVSANDEIVVEFDAWFGGSSKSGNNFAAALVNVADDGTVTPVVATYRGKKTGETYGYGTIDNSGMQKILTSGANQPHSYRYVANLKAKTYTIYVKAAADETFTEYGPYTIPEAAWGIPVNAIYCASPSAFTSTNTLAIGNISVKSYGAIVPPPTASNVLPLANGTMGVEIAGQTTVKYDTAYATYATFITHELMTGAGVLFMPKEVMTNHSFAELKHGLTIGGADAVADAYLAGTTLVEDGAKIEVVAALKNIPRIFDADNTMTLVMRPYIKTDAGYVYATAAGEVVIDNIANTGKAE